MEVWIICRRLSRLGLLLPLSLAGPLIASVPAVAQTELRGSADSLDPLAGDEAEIAIGEALELAVEPVQDDLLARQREAADQANAARENPAALPVQSGIARREEEDPFLPTGFRAGSWQVFTRFEQALGYATNVDFAADGEPGAFSQTDLNVRLESDWSRHQAIIEANNSLQKPFTEDGELVPTLSLDGDLRLDLLDGITANLGAGYVYTTESTSSDNLSDNVTERPGARAYSADAAVEREGGLIDLTLRGSFERDAYEEASLSGGGVLSQADRNNNLYLLSARTAFGPSPVLKPFVEGGVGWRVHDQSVDRNGEMRDSQLLDLRGGLEFDFGEKLNGEMALGYLKEDFEDANLETLETATVNGAIQWSPERDTLISLISETSLAGSTTAGESGSVVQSFAIDAERRVRNNLAVNASGALAIERFDDTGDREYSWRVGVGLEYFVSRHLSFTADIAHERLESDTPGDSWQSTSFTAGIALQR